MPITGTARQFGALDLGSTFIHYIGSRFCVYINFCLSVIEMDVEVGGSVMEREQARRVWVANQIKSSHNTNCLRLVRSFSPFGLLI